MPEKSGMEAALRVMLPAGPSVGDTACAKAGVETAYTIANNKKKPRSCKFMLASDFRPGVCCCGNAPINESANDPGTSVPPPCHQPIALFTGTS